MDINSNSMIKIEIDGVEFNAKPGSKIIEVADEVGVYIPRFCYHKKLSIAANCRMCLVEVEKAPKLFPACATPVSNGMKIHTNTSKVIEAQRAVMEFLLINHPLDCPICDQGGECELQDLTIGYGCSSSRFIEDKRSFNDYDLGPLVSSDITRCILCSRCVRFCEEISGTNDFGIVNRGSNSRIFTFLKNHLTSEISGNVIDLCPVGALTAKPSRFKYRAWELVQHPFISYHDCIGSNLYVHVFRDKVVRIVPKRNEMLNESWISDRDRFSYEGLYVDRIEKPILKKNGKWEEINWDEAYSLIYEKLNSIKNNFGSKNIGCLASPNSTLEEFFLLQKFVRNLGSNNIDHRLKQLDFSNQENFPIIPGIDLNINEFDNLDFVFIIGSNIVKEQPILGIKLRKIIKNGGKVFVLNPVDFTFSINLTEKYILNPSNYLDFLKLTLKKTLSKSNQNLESFDINLEEKNLNFNNEHLIESYLNSKKSLILLGSYVYSNPDYSKILYLSKLLSKLKKSNFGVLTDGANTGGGWISGFLPHRLPSGKLINKNSGYNTLDMLKQNLKAYILFGSEIDFDIYYSKMAYKSLNNAEFVLSFSSFKSKDLLNYSNLILPIASSYENSGTFINVSGLVQSFDSVVNCSSDVKLGWKAISDLGKVFKMPGFLYFDLNSVFKEIKSIIDLNFKINWENFNVDKFDTTISDKIIYLPSIYHYDNDPLLRRATSLQKVKNRNKFTLKCNSKTHKSLKIKQNEIFIKNKNSKNKYNIFIDNSISDNVIFVESCDVLSYIDFDMPYEKISFFN